MASSFSLHYQSAH